MSYFVGTIAHNTTGVKTVAVGFAALWMRVTVGQNGVAQNLAHFSQGVTDGTNQFYNAFYQDTTGGKTVSGIDKIVSHWDRVAGTLTEKLNWKVDGTTTWTATQVKYNVVTTDVNYSVLIEAGN